MSNISKIVLNNEEHNISVDWEHIKDAPNLNDYYKKSLGYLIRSVITNDWLNGLSLHRISLPKSGYVYNVSNLSSNLNLIYMWNGINIGNRFMNHYNYDIPKFLIANTPYDSSRGLDFVDLSLNNVNYDISASPDFREKVYGSRFYNKGLTLLDGPTYLKGLGGFGNIRPELLTNEALDHGYPVCLYQYTKRKDSIDLATYINSLEDRLSSMEKLLFGDMAADEYYGYGYSNGIVAYLSPRVGKDLTNCIVFAVQDEDNKLKFYIDDPKWYTNNGSKLNLSDKNAIAVMINNNTAIAVRDMLNLCTSDEIELELLNFYPDTVYTELEMAFPILINNYYDKAMLYTQGLWKLGNTEEWSKVDLNLWEHSFLTSITDTSPAQIKTPNSPQWIALREYLDPLTIQWNTTTSPYFWDVVLLNQALIRPFINVTIPEREDTRPEIWCLNTRLYHLPYAFNNKWLVAMYGKIWCISDNDLETIESYSEVKYKCLVTSLNKFGSDGFLLGYEQSQVYISELINANVTSVDEFYDWIYTTYYSPNDDAELSLSKFKSLYKVPTAEDFPNCIGSSSQEYRDTLFGRASYILGLKDGIIGLLQIVAGGTMSFRHLNETQQTEYINILLIVKINELNIKLEPELQVWLPHYRMEETYDLINGSDEVYAGDIIDEFSSCLIIDGWAYDVSRSCIVIDDSLENLTIMKAYALIMGLEGYELITPQDLSKLLKAIKSKGVSQDYKPLPGDKYLVYNSGITYCTVDSSATDCNLANNFIPGEYYLVYKYKVKYAYK